MTRLEKLANRLMSGERLTHSETKALLEAFGYTMTQGKGSGVKYVKDGTAPIVYHLPHNGRKELPEYVLAGIREAVRKVHLDV